LDKALLRPGRFDRQINVDLPDLKGRNAILKIHLSKLKLTHPVEFYSEKLSPLTPGFSGTTTMNFSFNHFLFKNKIIISKQP